MLNITQIGAFRERKRPINKVLIFKKIYNI